MIERRPYIAESIISPGCAVVQGSAENKVAAPGTGGAGAFVGVYPFEDNQAAAPDSPIGIAVAGIVPVLAGGTVTAGNRSALKSDRSGSFVNVASTVGQHPTCGTFLQSGVAGEYVDMIVERGTVTITTGGTGGEGSGTYTETDPTVPAWAKEANKPTYTAAEVGAYTTTETDEKIEKMEATFRGNFANWTALLAYSGDMNKNDRAIVQDISDYTPSGKTGTWQAVHDDTRWMPEHQINEEPLTTAQLAALNSGVTAAVLSGMQNGITNAQSKADAAQPGLKASNGTDPLPGATPVYSKAEADAAIGGIVGAGYIPITKPTELKAGYVAAYITEDKEYLILGEPDMKVTAVNRNRSAGANSYIEFNGILYAIPVGGNPITKSSDGMSWADSSLAPGTGDNKWAFKVGNSVLLISSQAGAPIYSTTDFETWTPLAAPSPFATPITSAMQTKTGRIIATNTDGTEVWYTDDGGAIWTAGAPLPTVTTNGGGSYGFSAVLANNADFPDRIVFVNLKGNTSGSGTGNCIAAYSDDDGGSWTLGPNASVSFKAGSCLHARRCGYLVCSVTGNGAPAVSRNGGVSWASIGSPSSSNSASNMVWVDDGSRFGVTIWKPNNGVASRMKTDLDVTGNWVNGPSAPTNTGFNSSGYNNRQLLFKGNTINFMSNALTWVFITGKVIPLGGYIRKDDFKALVAGAADYAAFQAAIAAL